MGSLRDRIAVVTGASRGVGIGCDGQKIFITNGGADVHLVPTRDHDTFGASKRTTIGLSLVLVQRRKADGSPNGVGGRKYSATRLCWSIGIGGLAMTP